MAPSDGIVAAFNPPVGHKAGKVGDSSFGKGVFLCLVWICGVVGNNNSRHSSVWALARLPSCVEKLFNIKQVPLQFFAEVYCGV